MTNRIQSDGYIVIRQNCSLVGIVLICERITVSATLPEKQSVAMTENLCCHGREPL